MAWNARQVVTVVSIVFLILVIAFACYGMHLINQYSLPIPYSLGAFSIILPAVTGVAIETTEATNRRRQRRGQGGQRPLATLIVSFVLTIYETVIATRAGSYMAPVGELTCGLDSRWLSLFRSKDSSAIRRIQDGFSCCGLHSAVDKAWPFPDKSHDIHSCQNMFGRDKSCFNDWRGQEQRTAAIFLIVAVLVFAWKMIILAAPESRSSWLRQMQSNVPTSNPEHGRLEYPDGQERYSDSVIREIEETPDQAEDPENHRVPQLAPVVDRSRSTSDIARDHTVWNDA